MIGTLNVCGLKRRSLYPEFVDLIKRYDISCALETKLDSTDIITLQGYQFINCPRKQSFIRKSGGIGFFIKDELYNFTSHVESQSDFLTWLHISKKYTKTQQDIILGVSYVPPQSSKYYNEDDFATLEEEVKSTCSKMNLYT